MTPSQNDLVGRVRNWFEWDWHGAEHEYIRAIEFNPGGYADARVFYCLLLERNETMSGDDLTWEALHANARFQKLINK